LAMLVEIDQYPVYCLPSNDFHPLTLSRSFVIFLNQNKYLMEHEEEANYSGFLIRVLNELQMLIKQLFNKFIVCHLFFLLLQIIYITLG
jgi:hypothetical protein